MPKSNSQAESSPADRLIEVASILAKGLSRCRKQAQSAQNIAPGIRLEVPANPVLSVSPSTRGLRLRDHGDRT